MMENKLHIYVQQLFFLVNSMNQLKKDFQLFQ